MQKGIKTLIAGIVLFIAGAFVVPFLFIIPLLFNDSGDQQFLVPGSADFEIEEAGRYYLWNDYQTIFEGRTYHRSESLPDGIEIQIVDQDGNAHALKPSTSISTSSGSSASRSIGYADLPRPGKVTVTVQGEIAERVFSFAPSMVAKLLAMIFGAIGTSVLISLAGLGFIVWGIVKLVKGSRHAL